jgi:hypothetical protein
VWLPYAETVHHEISCELPSQVGVAGIPPALSIDGQAIKYESSLVLDGSTLRFERIYSTPRTVFRPGDAKAMYDDYSKIVAHESRMLSMK